MIAIIDYKSGNIRSVFNAFKYLKEEVEIKKIADICNPKAVVLPGVGSFKQIADELNPYKKELIRILDSGIPFLGICVGLQYMFEKSYENGVYNGLGYFKGDIQNISFLNI